ncbi:MULTISPECIES: GGDEF domain-containing protein [unclassified Streptomyces]|uniref:GGDEF domain-containing protein n=1 Tax=unclassified Streptomyces TaxID=2593676 RepID=UPI000B503B67|nr:MULTISPECIES: GGDEF domain-containing protein [unclassified Streptomyces]MYX03602.1 diguanylate cyclase [Streptomyces sp. SID8378]SNB85134.1 diguanylate cyclase (GGDEF) domain-containing protein [Streptomyces sp. PgraA7]
MDTQALALALPLIGWASHTALLTHRLATARRDPLTGLRTRAGWTALAERIIRRHRDAMVLLLDLDDFKNLNDTHGHAAGDFALVVTAERLTAWCGRNGIAGRLGGDEFVAIARQAPDRDLESLHRALNQPVAYAGRRLPVFVSVGSCHVKDLPVRSLSDALATADSAMYAAKGTAGRRGPRTLNR